MTKTPSLTPSAGKQAKIHFVTGEAYRYLADNADPVANYMSAIIAYKKALKVWTVEAFPTKHKQVMEKLSLTQKLLAIEREPEV